MTKKSQRSTNDTTLRKRAEEQVKADSADIQETLSPEETQSLLHELRVHQVELEMQNEELRKSQMELEASRQRYFVQHEIAPVGFFTLSEKGLILEATLTTAAMLGVVKSALVNKSLTSFILPEDQDIYYLHSKKLFETGIWQACELRLLKKGGSPLWARMEATVVRDDDGLPVCCAVVNDITESKQAEDLLTISEIKYRRLFESAQDGILILDAETGKILDVNLFLIRLLGYSKEQFIEKAIWEIGFFKDITANKDKFLELQQKEYVRYEDLSLETSDGRKIKVEFISNVYLVSYQKVIQCNIRDITVQKRLEEELSQAKKFESISTFSAGIAHDFNNFLAIILNFITLSADDLEKPEEALLLLEEAKKTIFKVKDLTHNFLLLSGAGIEYNNTAEPYKLIKKTVLAAEHVSHVKYEFTLPEEERGVTCDPNLLSQIVVSIVNNSIEAMSAGGVLKIKAEHIAYKEEENRLPLKDGMYFFICISDNGCGISKEHLPRIFDPYFSTKQMGVQKGMGLSLSVVYLIIIRLKGYIRVESEKDVGTDVFIYLPSTGEPAVRDEKKQEARVPEITARARAASGTKRILFMDDEEALRNTTKIMLERAGYSVDVARHGEEALQKYVQARESGTPYDAVILDLSIVGGMGGVETIKKLLEINPQVKAIVSSGYSNDPVIYNYAAYGFQGALTKPATRAQLVEALKKLC